MDKYFQSVFQLNRITCVALSIWKNCVAPLTSGTFISNYKGFPFSSSLNLVHPGFKMTIYIVYYRTHLSKERVKLVGGGYDFLLSQGPKCLAMSQNAGQSNLSQWYFQKLGVVPVSLPHVHQRLVHV